ncbi:MAG TPA: ABC transporter ATP-binding protein [Bacillota bacterium]
MTEPLLDLAVTKAYPDFQVQVRLNVAAGEFLALLGPSGCGKTTLLRIIAGLERPDNGWVRLAGRDITFVEPAARRIGMVFQDYALFPHLTVAGNIEYGLKVKKMAAADRSRRVGELLELFELNHLGNRSVNQLSGGERQRVALARALAPQPLILLLDEPFAALDYGLRRRLRNELRELQLRLGFTVVFVTHQQEEALAVADRIGIMQAGMVLQTGPGNEIYEHPANRYVAELLGDANLIPCRISGEDGQYILHDGNEVALPFQEKSGANQVTPHSAKTGYLMIRPEDLILDPGLEYPAFTGTVKSLEYLGSTYQLTVVCSGGQMLQAFLSKQEGCRIRRGQILRLGFSPQAARFLSDIS